MDPRPEGSARHIQLLSGVLHALVAGGCWQCGAEQALFQTFSALAERSQRVAMRRL